MKAVDDKTKIYVNNNIITQNLELFMFKEINQKRAYCTFKITVESIPDDMFPSLPSLIFAYEEADQLMTELWNAGARPEK